MQTHRLQQAAPERAAELEAELRTAAGDQLHASGSSVSSTRSRSGWPAGRRPRRCESAANRGVAFVAGLILTIFFVLYGPALVDGGLAQVRDPERRRRLDRIVRRRGAARARLRAREGAARASSKACSRTRSRARPAFPDPRRSAVWVALWSLHPGRGVVHRRAPIVVFAARDIDHGRGAGRGSRSSRSGIGDWFVSTAGSSGARVDVGSFLIVLAAFAGLELYGFTGALLLRARRRSSRVAIVAELGPEEVSETLVAPLAGVDQAE